MIRIKLLLLLSIIILLLLLSYKEPMVYCEVNNTEYEDYIKNVLINCFLDIVKDDIFVKQFGITNCGLKSNSFYLQITEKFIRDFINSKDSLAIIFDESLDKEQMFKNLYELFYDYVENARRTYIRNRFNMLIPELPKILTCIIKYYQLYNFLQEKNLNTENVITTEGFKHLYEKEQRRKLSNILLTLLNINVTLIGDNTQVTINIQYFIFQHNYTYKYKS